MVSPSDWGPKTWELLHGIAERIGNQKHLTIARDEVNELRLTLRHFSDLLPCQKCQAHYREWLSSYPPEPWLRGPSMNLQDSLREWLYKLHEDVNNRREIVSGITLESLEERYRSVNLRECAAHLKSFYSRGVETRSLKSQDWKMAWKHLDLLIRLLS
jgi:Erv1 / Alr family